MDTIAVARGVLVTCMIEKAQALAASVMIVAADNYRFTYNVIITIADCTKFQNDYSIYGITTYVKNKVLQDNRIPNNINI